MSEWQPVAQDEKKMDEANNLVVFLFFISPLMKPVPKSIQCLHEALERLGEKQRIVSVVPRHTEPAFN